MYLRIAYKYAHWRLHAWSIWRSHTSKHTQTQILFPSEISEHAMDSSVIQTNATSTVCSWTQSVRTNLPQRPTRSRHDALDVWVDFQLKYMLSLVLDSFVGFARFALNWKLMSTAWFSSLSPNVRRTCARSDRGVFYIHNDLFIWSENSVSKYVIYYSGSVYVCECAVFVFRVSECCQSSRWSRIPGGLRHSRAFIWKQLHRAISAMCESVRLRSGGAPFVLSTVGASHLDGGYWCVSVSRMK